VFGKRIHICADRFHVAKLYRNGLENLRKSEWKRLCHILSKEERKSFKNVHWLLRQRRADLNADERRMLNRLFRYSPKLQEAYEACESLTAIYESRLSKGQGKRKLRGWMERVTNRKLSCFDSFLGTLNTHFEEVTNYFIGRHTSGFVEGLNNKIKVIKRRCYPFSACFWCPFSACFWCPFSACFSAFSALPFSALLELIESLPGCPFSVSSFFCLLFLSLFGRLIGYPVASAPWFDQLRSSI
jgi:hypothetical protein